MELFDAVLSVLDSHISPTSLCKVAADGLHIADLGCGSAQQLDPDLHAPRPCCLGGVGEKVLLTVQGLGGDVLPRRARVVAVVADLDGQGAAGREILLNVDEGLGRHGVGRHRDGLHELDRGDGLGEGLRPGDARALGVGGRDRQRVAAVQDPQPCVAREGEGGGAPEGRGVRPQRHAVQLFDDRDLMAVGVGDGVLVGRGRGRIAPEVPVAATDDRGPVVDDGAGDAGGVCGLRICRVVCLHAELDRAPSVGDGRGVGAGRALVDLRPCSAVDLLLEDVAREVAVRVGGLSPRDRRVLAADDLRRHGDRGRGGGGLVVDDRVAPIRVSGVGDQEIGGQITSGAQAVVAAVGAAPAQRAVRTDVAGEVGRPGIGVRKPPVPCGICARVAGVVGVGDALGRHGGDAAGVV